MTGETTEDLFLGGRLTLIQPRRGHRSGGDAMLLAAAATSRLRPGDAVVDFGAGVGAIGLALAFAGAGSVALVEIDPALALIAGRNVAANGLDAAYAVSADVSSIATGEGPETPARDTADLVVANPPFDDEARFRASPDPARAKAHAAAPDLIEEWCRAAARVLKPGGSFLMIHRPEAMAAILAALDRRFGDVRLRAVHSNADGCAARILMAARKGRRGALALLPPLVMHGADGGFSPEVDAAQRGEGVIDMGSA